MPNPNGNVRNLRFGPGEQCAAAKLTLSAAAEIKRRRLAGEHPLRLANEFGIAKSTVEAIKLGYSWRMLSDSDHTKEK